MYPIFDKLWLDAMVMVWLTSKKNLKFWNINKNTGCLLSKRTVIQPYKKRSFKSYGLFISNFFVVSFTLGNSMWFSSSNWQVNERTEGCVQVWQFQKRYLRLWCISVIYILCTYLYMYIVVTWILKIANICAVELQYNEPLYNKSLV